MDAYDCVGLVYRYLLDCGKNVSDVFRQWDLTNYYYLARGDKRLEAAIMRDWVLSLGAEIPVMERVAGDLLVINAAGIEIPAIYMGGGNVLTVLSDRGVRPMRLTGNIEPIMAVRV